MIYIHPTAAQKMKHIVAIQQATGMTISMGKRYACLVPNEDQPAPVQSRRAPEVTDITSYLQGPTRIGWATPDGPHHPGGGSAA